AHLPRQWRLRTDSHFPQRTLSHRAARDRDGVVVEHRLRAWRHDADLGLAVRGHTTRPAEDLGHFYRRHLGLVPDWRLRHSRDARQSEIELRIPWQQDV